MHFKQVGAIYEILEGSKLQNSAPNYQKSLWEIKVRGVKWPFLSLNPSKLSEHLSPQMASMPILNKLLVKKWTSFTYFSLYKALNLSSSQL